MSYLNFISDDNLKSIVTEILTVAKSAIESANSNPDRNVIDPFSVIFEMAGFNLSYDQWRDNEGRRQAQKSLMNHIGDFHQRILGSVKGWEDLRIGNVIDLKCEEKRIVAEVKNKHNTISGKDLVSLYDNLENQVMPIHSTFRGYTAYYVEVIPKKSKRYDIPFTPSDNRTRSRRASNERIRKIDGHSFYSLVTGQNDALDELFSVLPDVITECSEYRFNNKQALRDVFKKAFNSD